MSACRCACGYDADSADDLTDHLGEQYIPADDMAPADTALGGTVHAEAANDNRACVCGFAAGSAQALDAHLLDVFTPSDRIGADGCHHSARDEAV